MSEARGAESDRQRIIAQSEAAILGAFEELLIVGLDDAAIDQLVQRALANARQHVDEGYP